MRLQKGMDRSKYFYDQTRVRPSILGNGPHQLRNFPRSALSIIHIRQTLIQKHDFTPERDLRSAIWPK